MYDAPPCSIVLVGNAPSLLRRPGLGLAIDAFPVVVRFNNFVTTGYETFVGAKTSRWARAENDDILPRTEAFDRIVLRLQGEREDTFRAGEAALLPKLRRDYPDAAIDVIPRRVFTDLIDTYGFANAPLTGTLVASYLLETHERIAVCGFDNLTGTPESPRHYYDAGNIIGDWTTYHEPDKEAAYLREQINAGRVVVL
ncbi:MAG: glycosyltransferase family 29 protein [Armatimonadetes bacterium]|nr:glycosyltransferase family 29 protein [Armatimonadota bacterium]